MLYDEPQELGDDVSWPDQPRALLVIGPPGTGKTRAIMDRWLRPALQAGVDPERILATTFTRAAAQEMRDRARPFMPAIDDGFGDRSPGGMLRRMCSTIHSEAWRRVRAADIDGELRLIDEVTWRVRDAGDKAAADDADAPELAAGDRDGRELAMRAWGWHRTTLQPDDAWEGTAASFAARAYGGDAAAIMGRVEEYEDLKRRESAIDYTDILIRAATAAPRPGGLALMICDEAQDSTPLQFAVLRRWAASARSVILVADDDQCIHRWAGALPGGVLDFADELGAQRRALMQSYRVPARVHAAARSLILEVAAPRVDVSYAPTPDEGQVARVGRAGLVRLAEQVVGAGGVDVDPDDEYEAAMLRAEGGAERAPSMLVLARSAALLRGAEAALDAAAVPYRNERGPSPLAATNTLRAWLAVAGLRERGDCRVEYARALCKVLPAKGAAWRPRSRAGAARALVNRDADALVGVSELEALGMQARVWGGELHALLDGPAAASRERCSLYARMAERWGRAPLAAAAGGRCRVVLTTMHASKGREADVVVCLADMPREVGRELAGPRGVEALDDELRVLYVAATRARRVLAVAGFTDAEYAQWDAALAAAASLDMSVPF